MHSMMCVVATEFVPSTSIHDLLHHISNYSSQDQCHTYRSADRIYQLSIKGVHTNEIICVCGKNLVILHLTFALCYTITYSLGIPYLNEFVKRHSIFATNDIGD